MDLKKLLEIEEYAAYGYYEAIEEGLPYPVPFARALRRLYEMQPARVSDEFLTVPFEPFFESELGTGDAMGGARSQNRGEEFYGKHFHHAEASILYQFHSSGVTVSWYNYQKKKQKYPQHAEFIDELVNDLRTNHLANRSGYMHNNPDTETVVNKGFNFMIKEVEDGIAKAKAEGDTDGLNFLLAMQDYAIGVVAYYEKHKEALRKAVEEADGERKAKLSVILEGYEKAFLEPSESFVSGFISVILCWMLDGCDSIGRIDHVLGSRLEKDLAENKVDIEIVRELLDDLWRLFERFNGWNMQIGGFAPEGGECYNRLTEECIRANMRHAVRRPNLALRVTKNMPEKFWELALDSIAKGSGKPALYNDELFLKCMHEHFPEITPEDLTRFGLGGCTETMISGRSSVDSVAGDINLASCLMATLFNGKNVLTGGDMGIKTGDFKDFETFEDFYAALKTQIKAENDRFANWLNGFSPCGGAREAKKTKGDPRIVRSMFTRGCVENRKAFDMGGALYNWATVSYHATTVLIDSLAAIKKCVFEDKTISKETLIEALENDFRGYEDVQLLLKKADKFGNDIDWVDEIGKDLLTYTWGDMLTHKFARGGKIVPSIILFHTYEGAGKGIGATPNGRNARMPLNDSFGAFEGADRNGPTALMNSVLKLPAELAFGTPVFNMRFSKNMFTDPNGRKKIILLIKNFFERGGLQVQISVVSPEELRDAQKNPEKYKDLIVRIGGYSEFFVYLSPNLQETVIKRTEHV